MNAIRVTTLVLVLLPSTAGAAADPLCGALPGLDDHCEAWTATYDNPNGYEMGSSETGWAVEPSPAGDRVFVTGWSVDDATSSLDFITAAFRASDGAALWSARRHFGREDMAFDVAVSPDGSRVFVTGSMGNNNPGFGPRIAVFGTTAYDAATGTELWSASYDAGGAENRPVGLVATDDLVVVAGNTVVENDSRVTVVGYAAGTGEQLWALRLAGAGSGASDSVSKLALSPDRRQLVLTGQSPPLGSPWNDFLTMALSLDDGPERPPTVAWQARYDGPASRGDVPLGLAISPDGSAIFVTGGTTVINATGQFFEYGTVAYDAASGERRWVSRYDGGQAGTDQPAGIAVSADGSRVVVTGTSELRTTGWPLTANPDIATVAYDAATGAQAWVKRYGINSDGDIAAAIASSDGRVYVHGFSHGINGDRHVFTTIAYDVASGDQDWAARFNTGPAGLVQAAIGRSVAAAGGRVFATGAFMYAGSPGGSGPPTENAMDVGLVAYQA